MNLPQRQGRLERFFAALARTYAHGLGLGYIGTIRQLPPPPLPGERLGATRYYVNGLAPDGGGTRLVEFSPQLYAAVRKAEAWVETGRGPAPVLAGTRSRAATLNGAPRGGARPAAEGAPRRSRARAVPAP